MSESLRRISPKRAIRRNKSDDLLSVHQNSARSNCSGISSRKAATKAYVDVEQHFNVDQDDTAQVQQAVMAIRKLVVESDEEEIDIKNVVSAMARVDEAKDGMLRERSAYMEDLNCAIKSFRKSDTNEEVVSSSEFSADS